MSVQPRLERPARQPGPGRARLSAVPSAERPLRRVPFLFVLAAILGVGMIGLLVLNTTLQSQAFEAHRLNRQESLLANRQAALAGKVDNLRTPGALEQKAAALGMRPDPHPAFVKLPQGTIVGDPSPVANSRLPYWLEKTGADITKAKADAAKKKAQQQKKMQQHKQAEQQKKMQQHKQAEQHKKMQQQKQAQQHKQTPQHKQTGSGGH